MSTPTGDDLWRALANPVRRHLLDLLRTAPQTTGDLAAAFPELSRFAVMQHLEVLTAAGIVLVRRQGRHRYNHLNPVPLRHWYERWVQPLADRSAADLLALGRAVADHDPDQNGVIAMPIATDQVRTVRIECELRFRATQQRVFDVLTQEVSRWFPHSYGGDRVRAIVMEREVGGRYYEDWGDGAGHLYGHVTAIDAPHRLTLRGRIMPGTILDTSYEIEADGDGCVFRMSKVAVGPMTEEEAASVVTHGDLTRFEDALRAVIEGA
jgi:DNA-binding transcriptional ArsR family regulator